MTSSRKRAMTWALVAVGVAMLVLGGVLAATFPWQQVMAQAQAQAGAAAGTPAAPWFGPWHGYYGFHPWWGHGWGYWRGPRFFGGGLLILVLIIFLVSRFAWRRRYFDRGYWDRPRGDDPPDAEEILRRSFAEGRITEEEFRSRRDALRK